MKILKKSLIFLIFALVFLAFTTNTKAATLSQTNVSLNQGQTTTVYAYNVYSSLYVSSNSNSNIATVTISGNNINIYGNTSGSTNVSICEYNNASCNILYVTVSGSYYNNLSLSQTNLSLSVGQSSTITAYNNYGNLYVSSNSNSSVATATASGNSISVYGFATGSATLVICQTGNTNTCGTVYVTVGGNYIYPINNIGLNISNITLTTGGSAILTSANSQNLYVSSNSNPNVASTSNSSIIAGCANNAQYNIYTGIPCYYNNNYNNYNSGSVTVSALSAGTTTLTLCQNNTNTCNTIYVTVTGLGLVNNIYPYTNYNVPVPTVLGAQTCYFGTLLRYGMTGSNVYCLQSLLYERGYLNQNDLNSTFDWKTQNAVMSFQRDNYLYADGIVGRNTRIALFGN
ncbi:peptidoglycan-binding protein [Candidatus Nomurabacteria bacterium]|nr:peptidoglycan-binding protein [Candidatus Nomurabacteria bacterium]